MGKTNDINSMTKLYIFRSQKAGGRGASAVVSQRGLGSSPPIPSYGHKSEIADESGFYPTLTLPFTRGGDWISGFPPIFGGINTISRKI
jgi:hypothetical protein